MAQSILAERTTNLFFQVGQRLNRPARPTSVGAAAPWLLRPAVLGVLIVGILALFGWGLFDRWLSATLTSLAPEVRLFFARVTVFGRSGIVLWPVGVAIIALMIGLGAPSWLSRRRRALASLILVRLSFVFIAVAGSGLIVTTVKRLIGRLRPQVSNGFDPHVFDPTQWTAAYASFPSGHATSALAGAIAIGLLFPRVMKPLLVLAVVVCLSRVVIGAHFMTDVMAGALWGSAFTLATHRYFAARGLGFSPVDGKALRPSLITLARRFVG